MSYECSEEHKGISPTSIMRVKGTKLTNPLPVIQVNETISYMNHTFCDDDETLFFLFSLRQWLTKKTGVLTSVGCDHGGFFRTKKVISASLVL